MQEIIRIKAIEVLEALPEKPQWIKITFEFYLGFRGQNPVLEQYDVVRTVRGNFDEPNLQKSIGLACNDLQEELRGLANHLESEKVKGYRK